MEKLKEMLRPVLYEYASLVGHIIDREPQYWVADDICMDVCCFGDIEFLDISEMQVIIDHLDDWVSRYGSKKAVGETILAWMEWCLDDRCTKMLEGTFLPYPRINLWNWLKGLRPEQLEHEKDDQP